MRCPEAAAAASRPAAVEKSRPADGRREGPGRVAGVARLPRLDLVVAGVDVEREQQPRARGALGQRPVALGRDVVVVDADAVEARRRRARELERVRQQRDVVEVLAQRRGAGRRSGAATGLSGV